MKTTLLPILEEFSDDVESLCEEIKMLRDQKSNMLRTIDELNETITELETALETAKIEMEDTIKDNK